MGRDATYHLPSIDKDLLDVSGSAFSKLIVQHGHLKIVPAKSHRLPPAGPHRRKPEPQPKLQPQPRAKPDDWEKQKPAQLSNEIFAAAASWGKNHIRLPQELRLLSPKPTPATNTHTHPSQIRRSSAESGVEEFAAHPGKLDSF